MQNNILCLATACVIFKIQGKNYRLRKGKKREEAVMKAKDVAIILTGYQNEFCEPDGKLYDLVKDMLVSRGVIPNTVDLLKKAKEKKIATFITPIIFSEGYPELCNPVGIFKSIKEMGAFRKGTKGAETIKELRPFEDYMNFVHGKTGLSCFGNTDLEDKLKQKGIKILACTGLLTNVCVESTARYGYDAGYETILIKDCSACRSPVWQDYAENNVFPLLGRVMDHNEFLEQIE